MKKMNKKGFTLTELVIVIVIIAILAAVLIPSMTGYVNRAKKSNAQSEAASVYTVYAAWLADTAANYGKDSVKQSDLYKDSGVANLYINGLTIDRGTSVSDDLATYEIKAATIKTSATDGTLSCADIQYYTDKTSDTTKEGIETPTPKQVLTSTNAQSYETATAVDGKVTDDTNSKHKFTASDLVSDDRAYLDSFAYYYAQANETKAYDGKNVDNQGNALVTVDKLTFIYADAEKFIMYSSNGFWIECSIASGSPVYTVAEKAGVATSGQLTKPSNN